MHDETCIVHALDKTIHLAFFSLRAGVPKKAAGCGSIRLVVYRKLRYIENRFFDVSYRRFLSSTWCRTFDITLYRTFDITSDRTFELTSYRTFDTTSYRTFDIYRIKLSILHHIELSIVHRIELSILHRIELFDIIIHRIELSILYRIERVYRMSLFRYIVPSVFRRPARVRKEKFLLNINSCFTLSARGLDFLFFHHVFGYGKTLTLHNCTHCHAAN